MHMSDDSSSFLIHELVLKHFITIFRLKMFTLHFIIIGCAYEPIE